MDWITKLTNKRSSFSSHKKLAILLYITVPKMINYVLRVTLLCSIFCAV